jgi:hypothetical protein
MQQAVHIMVRVSLVQYVAQRTLQSVDANVPAEATTLRWLLPPLVLLLLLLLLLLPAGISVILSQLLAQLPSEAPVDPEQCRAALCAARGCVEALQQLLDAAALTLADALLDRCSRCAAAASVVYVLSGNILAH